MIYLKKDRSSANVDTRQYGPNQYNSMQGSPTHNDPKPHFNPGYHHPFRPDLKPGSIYSQGDSYYNQGDSIYNQGASIYNQAGILNNQLNGCSSSPCFNQAYCQSTGQYSFLCQCKSNYYGIRCERYHNPKGLLLGVVLGTVLPVFAIIIVVSIIVYICCLRRTKKY